MEEAEKNRKEKKRKEKKRINKTNISKIEMYTLKIRKNQTNNIQITKKSSAPVDGIDGKLKKKLTKA